MTDATDKQIDYIVSLWNKLNPAPAARFLSQTDIPLSQRQKRGGMTKVEASAIIDELKAELDSKN
ncbi:hypothetical protein [Propionibacterium freudenreichii]|uniref:hypothetical protein n=1 Tax=Propionibacterium freudenreichii TaxID=1744 RepID=UPI0004A0160A|nr:hypothetical protein [Propionibacterium freudenreichii]MDN5962584.1 hypothetical protein [Propionibacterium sp.]MCT2998497.1 hypothetical protein [Propionibacterium freudenreichii]MCT3011931.1 hypothetical protein [Propionibacterium freudenreichii]MDK9301873.1 hypothetical protein [Propionibacterium freudenreichii]MDK9319401.1 hypothetical protein [Propionibacterium freudenreichii]